MAVIGINYEEPNHSTYKSVRISYSNNSKEKVFDSGNFVKDWFDCNKFITTKLLDKEYGFSNSSSVDHFIMDGAPYQSAYLNTKDGGTTWELYYEYDHQDPGYEFFVAEGTKPTWKELKEICK